MSISEAEAQQHLLRRVLLKRIAQQMPRPDCAGSRTGLSWQAVLLLTCWAAGVNSSLMIRRAFTRLRMPDRMRGIDSWQEGWASMTSPVLLLSVMDSLRKASERSGSLTCGKAGACVHSCRARRQAFMTEGRVLFMKGGCHEMEAVAAQPQVEGLLLPCCAEEQAGAGRGIVLGVSCQLSLQMLHD